MLVRLCRVREAVISWLAGWALEVVEVACDRAARYSPWQLLNAVPMAAGQATQY